MTRLHPISGCENDGRKADVVFVHGLGGDAFTTWRHGEDASTSWLHWLGEEFPEVGVWSLGYAASPSRWARPLSWLSKRWQDRGFGMALPDRALQVLDLMAQKGLGRRPLLFIGHSLGGLVVKQILRSAADTVDAPAKRAVFDNTRAVLFLATPHAGATLASLADSFRTVFGTTVTLRDLQAHDAHLRDLYNWYRNHAPLASTRTATYYETRPVRGVIIVNATSAHPGVGADPTPLDEDHLSIAKPLARGDQVCAAAAGLLRDAVLAPRPGSAIDPAFAPVAPTAPPPVVVHLDAGLLSRPPPPITPHELPPAAEAFFGRNVELEQLIERLRAGKNTAVVGPAGLGKTALASEALRAVVGSTPADLARSPFPDGLVFLDLYTFHGEAEPAWHALANKLAGVGFMERSSARDRATEACRGRRVLIVVEGGEEADGIEGRANAQELLDVLSPQNRWLLLTRLSTQAGVAESVELKEALDFENAAGLLDSLTDRGLERSVRDRILELLEGHPLALTWAGNLLARGDDDPERLADEWTAADLPRLSDPRRAERTLEWLFARSTRGLDVTTQAALAAAALLARAPFPLAAIHAALDESSDSGDAVVRDALRVLVQRGLMRRTEERDHWQFDHVLGYRFARKETGSDREIRRRLANWLREHIVASTGADFVAAAQEALGVKLEHVAALLRTDDDQSLWDPLARATLYEIADRLEDLGRLALVSVALGAVETWMDRLPHHECREPRWRRERTILLSDQGDVLLAQGDLSGALAAYRESLAVMRRLAEADPSNAGWQRDLSVSQDRIGDVLRAQGDLSGALAAYRESLAVMRRLAEADPSNAGWQRDLSWTLTRLAEIYARSGDSDAALALGKESLAIDERLAALDPTNATWQHDVEVSRALVARLRG